MTVYDYVRGIFSTDGKTFRLSNSEKINGRWRNKTFNELSIDDKRKIKSTTIHAIIFEQKKPENDDTSLYQIFERINTSGRSLTPQEIRNCIYQGKFNTMLFELNGDATWRSLFGTNTPDSRMSDLECILRFFTIREIDKSGVTSVQISLKKVLNEFMRDHRDAGDGEIERYKGEFLSAMRIINEKVGRQAFRNYSNGRFTAKFHPAIFDAVSVAASNAMEAGEEIREVDEESHIALLTNEEFREAASMRTTKVKNIRKRVALAHEMLVGGGRL